MGWVRLSLAIIAFVTSCAGLGYFAGVWVRRRAWPEEVCIPMSLVISFIWPAVIVGLAIHDAVTVHYQALDTSFPAHAPAYVVGFSFLIGAPILFLLSFPLIFVSAVV